MKGHAPLAAHSLTIDPSWKIGIVASLWHRDILDAMINVAQQTLIDAGIAPSNITVCDASGSYEVPLIGSVLIHSVDALIGFGIVLQGETNHAQNIAQAATDAMMRLQVEHKKPFAFEILHVRTLEQAKERAKGPHNKGFEAATAVLHSLATLNIIRATGDRRPATR